MFIYSHKCLVELRNQELLPSLFPVVTTVVFTNPPPLKKKKKEICETDLFFMLEYKEMPAYCEPTGTKSISSIALPTQTYCRWWFMKVYCLL